MGSPKTNQLGNQVKHLLIILISILLLSSPVIGDNHKGETLYGWITSSSTLEWKGFGDKESHPIYKGDVENGKPNGLGVIINTNKGKYVGEWKDGKKQGQGTFTYGKGKWEGDKYEGMWKRGEFQGHGTYTRSDGHKIVGEWKNNVLNDFTEYDKYGIIVRKYVNGVKVLLEQTRVVNEKRERGILFRDGPRIKWEEGGKKWFTTGDEKTQGKYEGEILEGIPHGQGTYYWFNVNRYEGGWEYGLFDGQGTYYSYPSGVKVVGEFRRDKEWNTLRYDKDGNIIEKIVRGKLKKD